MHEFDLIPGFNGRLSGIRVRKQLLLGGIVDCGFQHHPGSLATDFDSEVGAPIPWIDLAHAGEIKPWNGRLNAWDIA